MLAASGVALIPIAFFIFFGATDGGLGLQLILRVAPIAALIALGWYQPQTAGWALIVLGILFAGLYAVSVDDLRIVPTAGVAVLFCLPLISSGALFLQAHHRSSSQRPILLLHEAPRD